MIRLRVSTLESFRQVMQTDYGSEAELIERLKRGQWAEGPTKWQMDAGTSWHAVLADPFGCRQGADGPKGESSVWCESGDYWFSTDDVSEALAHVGPGLREVTGRTIFQVGREWIEVEGTADRIQGNTIRDAKTKFSTPDARDYEQSLQWRFYLLIHGAEKFTYDLFDFRDPKDGYCELKGIVSFSFWRYADLYRDCLRWIDEFLHWAGSRNLLPMLDYERKEAA